jgi:PhoH-like ATPase
MLKTFVLDTNVLLHDPNSIFAFGDNNIILPLSVISELDSKKRRTDYIGSNAREVTRQLDKLRQKGSLSDGVSLDNGGILRIEINNITLPDHLNFDFPNADLHILAITYNLTHSLETPVILVTKDLNLRIAADVLKLKVEDFYSDNVDLSKLYSGWTTIEIEDPDIINTFYKEGKINFESKNLYPNQFCILKCQSSSALARFFQNQLLKLTFDGDLQGIHPKNKEQRFAIELLLNDSISVVSLMGNAGTGKTLLALSSGLCKIFDKTCQLPCPEGQGLR